MWKHQFVSKKDVADVHHHCGLTWWAFLLIIDEKIVSVDIYINLNIRHEKFVKQLALCEGQFITKT